MTISKKYKNSNIKILEKEFTGFAAKRLGSCSPREASVDTKGTGFKEQDRSLSLKARAESRNIKYHTIGLSSKTNNNFVTDNIPQVVKTAVKKIKKTPLIDTTKLLTQ